MKRLSLLVLMLAAGFYVIWPAYSGYEIRAALEAKDSAALSSKIDFASVKESLRPAATAEAERSLHEALQKAGGGAGALGGDIAKKVLPNLVEKSLDVIVTPESIIRIYSEGRDVRESVSRMVADELGKSGGISGLGALIGREEGAAGKSGGVGGALDAIGKATGIDLSKVVKKANPSPVRTVAEPAQPTGDISSEKPGYGIGNIKRIGLSGPLSVELGVAKDAAADAADVTAEMTFTGSDWKLTAIRPRLPAN